MHNLGEERMAQRGASGIRWKRFFRAIVGGSALGRAPRHRRGLIKVRQGLKPRWKHKRQPKRKQSIKLRRIINKHRPQRRTQTLAACWVLMDIAFPTLETQF
ncbi:unnamed protein product [Peronospora effusa]|nr:unnamed protein product [Peronospora effusa]